MATKRMKRPGPPSLFPGKVRRPVSLTLTQDHHDKVKEAVRRLGRTRAELFGLLVEKYAETVRVTQSDTYKRLCVAVEVLGGTLEYQAWNGPRGGAWLLTLGRKQLRMESKPYSALNACYRLKEGITISRSIEDHDDEIDPAGLAQLFRMLASSEDQEAE